MAHAIHSEQVRSRVGLSAMPPAPPYPLEEVGFDIGCIGFCVQGIHRERGTRRFLTHEIGRSDAKVALELLIPEVPEAELSLSAKGFFSQEVPEFERKAAIMSSIIRASKFEARPGRFILEAVGWYGPAAKVLAEPIWMPVWRADQ